MKKCGSTWLGLVVLSLATLLVMGGCGGSSSSSSNSGNSVGKATISGAVSFPSLNSLVGKQVAKSVAATPAYTLPTVELRNLSGAVIATAVVTGTDPGPYSYTFNNIDMGADYVVKAYIPNKSYVIKALISQDSLSAVTTRNVDTVSTTAVIVTEKKLGATLGSLGDTASTSITSSAIAGVNPLALESSINTAIGTVNGAAGTASQDNVNLVNLVNVVASTIYNNVNTTQFIAGTSTTTTISTTQYTYSAGTGAAASVAPVAVQTTAVLTTLGTAATNYIAPPSNTVAFTSRVTDGNLSTVTPLANVSVTTDTGLTTYTDASGYYTLVNIPQNTSFVVKMSLSGRADSYSAKMSYSANANTSDRPYNLWTPSTLTNWGNTTGNSIIRARVVASTDLVTGYIGGVVVTATDATDSSITYPVVYTNATTGAFDPALVSTSANGQWAFRNVPAGRTVNVTASKNGYSFNTRTFVTVADAVCQGRITGTAAAVVTPPASTNTLQASLQAGWYDIRSDNSNGGTNYYSVNRMGLDAAGVTITDAAVSYLDPVSKTWVTTMPTGFPTKSANYSLSPNGAWVNDDAPQGFAIVFNTDGTARLTSPKSNEIVDVSVNTVDLTGQAISTSGLSGVPLLASTTVFPSGSVAYKLNVTSVTDTYQLWNSYSGLTTLAAVPAAFAENATGGMNIYFENNSSTEYFYGKFVNGSNSAVNIYRNTQNSTTLPTLIGTTTATTSTVLGQTILEISVPAAFKTTYGLTENPIFAVNAGVVMQGAHSPIGPDTNKGGSMYNLTALNHIKSNINTALAKSVIAKSISKAIIGR